MDSGSLIAILTPNARAWITEQREAHRASSVMLSDSLRGAVAPYFDAVTLERARIRLVPLIQNPPFYDALVANAGSVPLIDFRARFRRERVDMEGFPRSTSVAFKSLPQ
jgi:hypothetical protein